MREFGSIRRGGYWLGMGLALVMLLSAGGCGMLDPSPPTWTPIYVTATDIPAPIVATETPTVTPVVGPVDTSLLPTQGPTRTPMPSAAPPITMTPTFTPSPTDTPVTPGAVAVYGPVGGVPGDASSAAASGCAVAPAGGFAAIYQGNADVQAGLGCPLSGVPTTAESAYETFQNGLMIWVSSLGSGPQEVIYALYNNGTYQRFNDTWQEGVDPESGGQTPPEGLMEPRRGFGKVWRDNPTVRDTLGWATSGENAGSAMVQLFERGEMIYVSQAAQTYVMISGAPGTWLALNQTP